MLTHNRSEELCRSLAHLLALPEQPLVIVVDNASTDDTLDCVSARFPQARLVRAERNLGAAGRNLGVEHVRTPYVAFSDDDTWWAPGSLHTAADLLDGHPDIAVLNACIAVGPEARPDPACTAMASSPLEAVAGVGPRLTGFMAGAAVMRTSAFIRAGGYWRAFFIGGEEALLALDILDANGLIVYAPALQMHHWPSKARDDGLRRRLIARNGIWTAWLRLPWRLAWRRTLQAVLRLPTWRLRFQVLADALREAAAIRSRRRVLRPETCALLKRVWQHETQ
ncbi:glycosyltransferase family 2 protein [Pusillimonas sp. SM2304]|uniref:glycosyltransferase family 2 protein n=1 Tax=Pusillimonas sp. SM2304 TaxID=3073241 RepID=UPI0038F70AD1